MHDLQRYNPYPAFRVGQEEAAQEIIDAALSGAKIIEYRGPTGCGKSLVLTIVARALVEEKYKRTIYTTPQKSLVGQLAKDERLGITTLLGRANYPCPKVKSNSAADCPVPPMARRRSCPDCPYQACKDAFLKAPLAASTLDKILVDRSIPTPNILIVDESQGLEAKLIEQRAIQLPDTIDMKNLQESIEGWIKYVEMEQLRYTTKLEKLYARSIDPFPLGKAVDEMDLVKTAKTLTKIGRVLEKARGVYRTVCDRPDGYVIDAKRNFKLIAGREMFENFVMNTDLVILASGTPCTQMLAEDYSKVVAPHPVEVDRRRVYYDPCGKMNMYDRDRTMEIMANRITELHKKFNKNTLIHCHSYPIADRLGNMIYDQGVRCMWVKPDDREGSIQAWKEAENVCLMSVACEEGLDLPGEKYPLNIIAKVPFGYLGDEWFKKRTETDKSKPIDQRWEKVSVAVAIQQAAGRCTRGPGDWSETYILDGSFEAFYKYNYKLFENWFKDALMRKA